MGHWTETLFVDNATIYLTELLQLDELGETEVEQLLVLLEREGLEPSSVLDVGCGLGRHARSFAARGIETTGIDLSSEFLRRARNRVEGTEAAESLEFRELDMRALGKLDRRFDLIVCLYNTFGYFDDEENVEVLRKFREQLTDDGVCAIQVGNKDGVLLDFPESRVREEGDALIVDRYEFNSRSSRLTRRRDLFRGDPRDRTHVGRTMYEVRLFSPPDLERALADAGFEDVRLYDGYSGSPIGRTANRIVALAE